MQVMPMRLKKLRQDAGLLQKDIAKKLNISTSAYGYYEQGKRIPDSTTLDKLAEIFNVSADYLLGRTDSIINTEALTKKDRRDISKDVASIMNKIKNKEDGPAYYNGVEMDSEDAELFEQALEFALRSIKIENKEKYTPKKYRK